MRRILLAPALALAVVATGQKSTAQPISCLAVADRGPTIIRAALTPVKLQQYEVQITYVGHSTYRIETAAGVTIATDFAGNPGGGTPTAVTMNHAHSSHYTDFPDPNIQHVLRGWSTDEKPAAEHNLVLEDVRIRNVPTNIRTFGATREFGNSIFIFEVAGLCIGHLGHLHHELTIQQLAQVGQLDVVMVPVDGTYTLDLDGMRSVLRQLKAKVVLPMHVFSDFGMQTFLAGMAEEYEIKVNKTPTLVVSRQTMPEKPQVIVMPWF